MINSLLRFAGLVAFLSGQAPRGNPRGIAAFLLRVLQFGLQALIVGGAAALITYALVANTRHWIDDVEVGRAIEEMIAVSPTESQTEALRQELAGDLMMATYNPDGGYGLSVVVGVDALPEISRDPCDPRLTTPPSGTVCLFRARPIFVGQAWLGNFVSFEFPGTAYTIPHLAIAASIEANPERTFTQSRSASTRQMIERLIGEELFLPSDSLVLWGRRVNGPIQAITFALTASAILMLVLAWLNSCVQNAIVKLKRTVSLEAIQSAPISPPSAAENPAETLVLDANQAIQPGPGGPEAEAGFEPDQPPEETSVLVQRDFPTPWSGDIAKAPGLDFTDAHMTARYYDQVSTNIQNQSVVFGVAVDPPVLRFRRAAARAVANTEDTSILPPFLDAQKDSILAFYDARLSLVRFMLWVIPTVGFIGTILGVSDALSSTIGLQSARDLVAGIAQSSVSASMGMAFDTTLVALIAAVIVMLIFHLVQGAEERMTVLERDRAEAEILELSHSVRKPGTTADLAQQLISLGVNTEHLVKDLRLFQSTGPEFRQLIDAMTAQVAEMENAGTQSRQLVRRRVAIWRIIGIMAIVAAVLGINGTLGEQIQVWLFSTRDWMANLF